MSWATARACLLLVSVSLACRPAGVAAQGWSVDVSAGRSLYDVVAAELGTSNLMGTARYETRRGVWVYGTGAVPMREGTPVWGAFGAGGRVQRHAGSPRVTAGADLVGHGYVFQDRRVDRTGSGGTIGAMSFVALAIGRGRVEGRGGWRGHTLSYAGAVERRGVVETGVRVSHGDRMRVQGDVLWVHAREGTYPFAGVSLVYGGTRAYGWGQVGKWLSHPVDEVTWSAGAGWALGAQATVWASVRQEAPDPLYWNAPRRTWSAGITHRLGRRAGVSLQPAARADDGAVLIRIAARDAPGDTLSIAGDFNGWQPVPMRREGPVWVIRLALAPGVYNYAFRSATGDWFVPASMTGRRDDGMGGHVAVLVVS